MRKINKYILSKYSLEEIGNIVKSYLYKNVVGFYTYTTLLSKWKAEEAHRKISSGIIIDEGLFNKSGENGYNIIHSEISDAIDECFFKYITDQEVDIYFKVSNFSLKKDNPFFGEEELDIYYLLDLFLLIEYGEKKVSQLNIKKEEILNKIFKGFYKIK